MPKAPRTTPGPTNSNAVRRRRPLKAAAALVAKSATNLVDLPGLRDSVNAVQGIVQALQAPGQNDASAQELIDRVEEMMGPIVPLAENISLNVSDGDSETANYLVKVQTFIEW
ncbi:hypothetical protein CTheo_1262 [Ceratobasidium theobromae]|uniref:Uncharacterized protein n=1 Tax=Ceratobasidium theobromae TaxID=1582974 RepID=A0A5N5QU31_9AGAM|nr:hypothetical protein CTheo_1262 [Ceratobasidium theobromae]